MPASTARPFWKVWSAESLLSDDLDELTDHEHRIWFRLMCVAALETPRWHANLSQKLAVKCRTTLPKLRLAVEKMASLNMLEVTGEDVFLLNAAKWNEDTEKGRKPSDSPDAIRGRVAKHRNALQADDVTRYIDSPKEVVTPDGNALKRAHKEEEEEEEKEEECNAALHAADDDDAKVLPIAIRESVTVLLEMIPRQYQDALTAQSAEDVARLGHTHAELHEARRAFKAANPSKLPFPDALRPYLPKAPNPPSDPVAEAIAKGAIMPEKERPWLSPEEALAIRSKPRRAVTAP